MQKHALAYTQDDYHSIGTMIAEAIAQESDVPVPRHPKSAHSRRTLDTVRAHHVITPFRRSNSL
jgi:hypothetical protein